MMILGDLYSLWIFLFTSLAFYSIMTDIHRRDIHP